MNKLLIVFCTFILMSVSEAQELSSIKVSGKAVLTKQPDQFQFSLTFSERGRIASKTKTRVDHKTEQMINYVLKFGLDKSQIKATQFQVTPIYEFNNQPINEIVIPQSIQQYPALVKIDPNVQIDSNIDQNMELEISRTIDITLFSLVDYEKIIDRAIKIGISRLSPIHSSIADPTTLYQNALELAIKNAQFKAEKLVKKINMRIEKVIDLEELPYQIPSPVVMTKAYEENYVNPTTFSGEREISAEVSMTFAITSK